MMEDPPLASCGGIPKAKSFPQSTNGHHGRSPISPSCLCRPRNQSNTVLVPAIQPEIVNHPDPQKRERWDDLRHGRGIAASSYALGDATVVKRLNGLTSKAIIVCYGIGDQRLDARVADILHALPIRRIHVRIMRIEPSGAPANLPDRLKRRII